MNEWKIVRSKSGTHQEFGYPLSQILVRYPEDINKAIKEAQIHDPEIIDYNKEKK